MRFETIGTIPNKSWDVDLRVLDRRIMTFLVIQRMTIDAFDQPISCSDIHALTNDASQIILQYFQSQVIVALQNIRRSISGSSSFRRSAFARFTRMLRRRTGTFALFATAAATVIAQHRLLHRVLTNVFFQASINKKSIESFPKENSLN